MPPASREAAQFIARQAAENAYRVYRALVSCSITPAGAGVELDAFRRALPWFRSSELVDIANHCGKKGNVLPCIGSSLAVEIGQRLVKQTVDTGVHPTAPDGHDGTGPISALTAKQVSALTYAFSKLRTQLPEYSRVYHGVCNGVRGNLWLLSRLQAALIGTAIVDVELHVADVSRLLTRPILEKLMLQEEVQRALTVDELRFLLHACIGLSNTGIGADEIQVLSLCTIRHLPLARFSKTAHLAASWLQIRPPSAAKQAYLDALIGTHTQLNKQTPQVPAHPLPSSGLARTVAALLECEGQPNAPPLTPPKFRSIATGLMRISWGALKDDARSGRSLGMNDWVEMLVLITDFCKDHERQDLPDWAREVLGHVFLISDKLQPDLATPDLPSLLLLLRLLRLYRPRPRPGPVFFSWVARMLASHEIVEGELATVAEIIGELVPHLPEQERGQLTQMLVKDAAAPIPKGLKEIANSNHVLVESRRRSSTESAEHKLRRPLLTGLSLPPSGVTSGTIKTRQAPVAYISKPVEMPPASDLFPVVPKHKNCGRSLWGLLSQAVPQDANFQQSQTAASTTSSTDHTAQLSSDIQQVQKTAVISTASTASSSSQHLAEREDANISQKSIDVGMSELRDTQEQLQSARAGMAAMQSKLEAALHRVEMLQTRLEDHEQRRATEAAAKVVEPIEPRSWTPLSLFPESMHVAPGNSSSQSTTNGLPPMSGTLQLHRPFNFEEFRRANSQKLQTERLRVLCPPDHVPMWLMSKK